MYIKQSINNDLARMPIIVDVSDFERPFHLS